MLTHIGEGRTASARRRSFNAVPLRKPLRVDEATPYALRVLPAPIEALLEELRALRTLSAFPTVGGMAGTGRARREVRDEEP